MLKIEHLSKNYGSFPALRDLSIEIPDGALHGFVGPNGAGKTTTMRILATLMRPTAGTAYVDGTDIIRDGQKARTLVGYMPDFFGVYDNLKCWEYLDFYGRCYRIGAADRKRMTRQLLELVKLGQLHCVRLKQLSTQREGKKITAAAYAYQVDNGGAWGEIQFDLEKGTAWVEIFAENDPCDTWEITDAAIHAVLANNMDKLPKSLNFPLTD